MFGRECLAYLSDPPAVISWSYTASTTVWLSFSRTLRPSCNPSFVPHYNGGHLRLRPHSLRLFGIRLLGSKRSSSRQSPATRETRNQRNRGTSCAQWFWTHPDRPCNKLSCRCLNTALTIFCSRCAPAACAAPTCTFWTVSYLSRSCHRSPAMKSVASWRPRVNRLSGLPSVKGWAYRGSAIRAGIARYCMSGRENLCDDARFTG